jgi:hypothetical protein
MLEFLKKTPQKEVAMISKRYRRATDYGKKTVILSCDLPPNGDIESDNKWTRFSTLLKTVNDYLQDGSAARKNQACL